MSKELDPALAPGHTDLMVKPESLDTWLEANPMTYDRWKTHSPDDNRYDPALDEKPTREQEEAVYLDEQLQGDVMSSKKRKFAFCKNGHRSTVPEDAFSTENASTHACPICGLGVRIERPEEEPRGDYSLSRSIDPLP